MKLITEAEEISYKIWKKFVNSHPYGNFFQDPDTFYFFQDLKGYKPVVLALEENEKILGLIIGIMFQENTIKGIFSRRTIVWGGPLIVQKNESCFDLLFSSFDRLISNRNIYVEFRNIFSLGDFKDMFYKHGFSYNPHLNIRVATYSEENILKHLNKGKLRQIKSSLKNGANVIQPFNIEQIEEFYIILKNLYKHKIRKPLPSYNFFASFYLKRDLGRYFLIEYKGKIIGGIMCPVYNGKIIYEWYVAGQDKKIQGIYPSVLATWAAIKYASENNMEYFDFMGAGHPGKDYGVRNFKMQFGGEMVEYGRFIKIYKPLLFILGKIGMKLSRMINQI